MSIIGKIVGNLGGKVVESLDNRSARKHETAQRKMELEQAKHIAKLELVKQGQQADNAWELEQIKNSGWKDELVLVLLSIPMVLSFIPGTVAYVEDGFAALSKTPDWYQWLILVVFAAIYGIRVWRRK